MDSASFSLVSAPLGGEFSRDCALLGQQNPVVHAVPVVASANLVANALHAVGASPVMAIFPPEIPSLHKICSSVVISLGSPDRARWKLLDRAAHSAVRLGLPLVLDPVGAGFSRARRTWAQTWLARTSGVLVRGNRAEVLALAVDTPGRATPIDAPAEASSRPLWEAPHPRLIGLAQRHVVLATGVVDFLWSGERMVVGTRGHRWQARVTGMGCALSALCGAFRAVNPDPFVAAAHGLWLANAAAERAALGCDGPGTFATAWLDSLAWLVEHPQDCWTSISLGDLL